MITATAVVERPRVLVQTASVVYPGVSNGRTEAVRDSTAVRLESTNQAIRSVVDERRGSTEAV